MKVEFDRNACAGWFQCVQKWDGFEMNTAEGKADLAEGEEVEDGLFVRQFPEHMEDQVKASVKVCPVDAISVRNEE